jgi:hypothetical protein
MNTQCKRVIDYMETHGSITPLEALQEISVMRLASRISDLRKQGYSICKEMVKAKNKFGEPVCFAKYSLIGENSGT